MNGSDVIVTGMGIVCAIGEDKDSFWHALSRAQCGIGTVDLFDVSGYRSRIGGQVRNVDFFSRLSARECRRLGRCDRLGLWAAQEALREAKIVEQDLPPERIAVVMGAGAGGVFEAERYRRQLYEGEVRRRPSLLMPFPACNLTDAIANFYGFRGPRSTIATACSSSATAIGYGADLIRSGKADVVIAGGAESLSELTFSGFNALRSVDRSTCRPYDKHREGLVLGESGSILVLESRRGAEARGIPGYAQVLGYGICADAHHMTSPDPQGDGAERSMANALRSAGVSLEAVDYINAHGTGTVINDRVETIAIKRFFGKKSESIPVSSIKSALGHCLGAAGAVEAVATILSLYHGLLPPTVNYQEPDPDCDLDYVPNEARVADIQVALSNSFAFGGNNTTLVFGRTDP
ncbi:MAG: beta-ketoacyl-[acyl-carrier-protein] synthase family protein [Deltaproteobacteria bacterium]|nr:beta-ketoacyl-[acyl-carrier-protein] synthase family protein [Deltaproteobacteria bacterium]